MFIKLINTNNSPVIIQISKITSIEIVYYNRGGGYDIKVHTDNESYKVNNSFEDIEKKLGDLIIA